MKKTEMEKLRELAEANRKERCDFDVIYRDEKWHINTAWIQPNGKVAWYDGETYRDGTKIMRIFSPSEIRVPKIVQGDKP